MDLLPVSSSKSATLPCYGWGDGAPRSTDGFMLRPRRMFALFRRGVWLGADDDGIVVCCLSPYPESSMVYDVRRGLKGHRGFVCFTCLTCFKRISLVITQYTCVRQQPMKNFLCCFFLLYVA